jgi:hypothetical protein
VAALVHQIVVGLIGEGRGDVDFAALLEIEARRAGLDLLPEDRVVSDGLEVETPAPALSGADGIAD